MNSSQGKAALASLSSSARESGYPSWWHCEEAGALSNWLSSSSPESPSFQTLKSRRVECLGLSLHISTLCQEQVSIPSRALNGHSAVCTSSVLFTRYTGCPVPLPACPVLFGWLICGSTHLLNKHVGQPCLPQGHNK
jgi:hypothetical protein